MALFQVWSIKPQGFLLKSQSQVRPKEVLLEVVFLLNIVDLVIHYDNDSWFLPFNLCSFLFLLPSSFLSCHFIALLFSGSTTFTAFPPLLFLLPSHLHQLIFQCQLFPSTASALLLSSPLITSHHSTSLLFSSAALLQLFSSCSFSYLLCPALLPHYPLFQSSSLYDSCSSSSLTPHLSSSLLFSSVTLSSFSCSLWIFRSVLSLSTCQ